MPLFRLVSWLNLREPPYSRHENAARAHEILGTMSKTLKQKRGQTTSKTTAKIIAKILAVYYRKPRRQFIHFLLNSTFTHFAESEDVQHSETVRSEPSNSF